MIRGRRKGGVRRRDISNLKSEPAGDKQRTRRRVSTWGRVREEGEAQEKEIRRMGVGSPDREGS